MGVICRLDTTGSPVLKASTVNISSGGLLMHVNPSQSLEYGSIINFELHVPPSDGSLDFGGRLSGLGRVVRVEHAVDGEQDISAARTVALQFCQSPHLNT